MYVRMYCIYGELLGIVAYLSVDDCNTPTVHTYSTVRMYGSHVAVYCAYYVIDFQCLYVLIGPVLCYVYCTALLLKNACMSWPFVPYTL